MSQQKLHNLHLKKPQSSPLDIHLQPYGPFKFSTSLGLVASGISICSSISVLIPINIVYPGCSLCRGPRLGQTLCPCPGALSSLPVSPYKGLLVGCRYFWLVNIQPCETPGGLQTLLARSTTFLNFAPSNNAGKWVTEQQVQA